jgi:hypothetical protein
MTAVSAFSDRRQGSRKPEVAALAPLGNPQLDRTGTGLPVPVAVAAALVASIGAAFAVAGIAQALSSIRRWAAKPIISRRNVAWEPFSRTARRAILSSVIVVILGSELRVATPLTGSLPPDSRRSRRRVDRPPSTPLPGTRRLVTAHT